MKKSNAILFFVHCCFLLFSILLYFADAAPTKKQKEELWIMSMKQLMDNNVANMSVDPKFWFYQPEKKVKFYLFTRKSEDPEVVTLGNVSSLKTSGFDYSKNTKIIIHGWLSSGLTDFSSDLKDAYQGARNCNVITVDWPAIVLYSIARLSVDPVARFVAKFMDFLVTDGEVDINSIHLLGHSLGAHIAGIAGANMRKGRLPWITGLDPAGPLFSSNPESRIDSSDADFVDIVHTGGNLIGYYEPIGHVDFYPNGGTPIQPGCGIDLGICTHCRSYMYYMETISDLNPTYLAVQCDDYDSFEEGKCCENIIKLGVEINKDARGKYYLFTADKAPFGLGKESLTQSCLNNPAFIDSLKKLGL